jgi:hypothetical protein
MFFGCRMDTRSMTDSEMNYRRPENAAAKRVESRIFAPDSVGSYIITGSPEAL